MNNEKTLEKLHGIAELLPEDDRKAFDYCRKHPDEARKFVESLGVRVALAIAGVETDLRHDAAKKNGNGNRQKAAERVLKNAKSANPMREAFHGAWIENGAQYLCDGFRAYILGEPLPLPTIPEDVQKLDINRLFDSARKNDGDTLALPDLSTLRAYIKTEKARKKATKDKTPPEWDFGEALPMVNAQYLLDTLELLPECTAITARHAPALSTIYFESVHGCGILCPVRKAARV